MFQLKPNKKRGLVSIAFTTVLIVIGIIKIAVYIWQAYLIDAFSNGNAELSDLTFSDQVVKVMIFIGVIFQLISIIIFILWFRRAYYNIHQLSSVALKYGEGWAAGGWFIPIGNLFIPFQIMRDLWRTTLNLVGGNKRAANAAALVYVWWLCYLIFALHAYVAPWIATSFSEEATSRIELQCILFAVGNLIGIFSFIAQLIIIRQYAHLEVEMLQKMQEPDDGIFSLNTTGYQQSYEPSGNS